MDPRISKAMRMLERQVGDTVDFKHLATSVGLSRFRFHHLFVQETGETPGSFLRRARLDLAAMRLRWTRDTVGQIAHGLGYRSQGSFNHAFLRRFGVTPTGFRSDFVRWPNKSIDGIADNRVTLTQNAGFNCLCRRYLGPYARVPDHWSHFLQTLRDMPERPADGLYLGLTYDDPRFTPAEAIRYDCCITVGETYPEPPGSMLGYSLHRLETKAGLYTVVRHRGDYVQTIGNSYSLILDNWVASQNRYTMADDPAIEVYSVPPSESSSAELACMILVPLQ